MVRDLVAPWIGCVGPYSSIAENRSDIFKKFEILLKGNYFGKQHIFFILPFLSHYSLLLFEQHFALKTNIPKKTHFFTHSIVYSFQNYLEHILANIYERAFGKDIFTELKEKKHEFKYVQVPLLLFYRFYHYCYYNYVIIFFTFILLLLSLSQYYLYHYH